jgi:transposase
MNGSVLVVLRLAPYSPMLNPIEGCWNVLKAKMRRFMVMNKEEFLVRGGYDIFTSHRLALIKKAVEVSRP